MLRRLHHLGLLFLCLCAAVSSPFLFSFHTFAFNDPIIVTSHTDTVNFPQSIDFQLSARDSLNTLTEATIYLNYNGKAFQEEHQVAVASGTHEATFRWHDDLTRSTARFTPPGTRIGYYWIIVDSEGNSHTDEIQTFEIDDNRFTWQHLTQDQYQVNWYNRPIDFGQAILDQVDAHGQRISQNLGSGPQHLITLWLYQNNKDFQGALPPHTYEWVGGIAFPSLNEASIVVDGLADDTLVRDMPHELTHLIFHQRTAQGLAPIWFDEGLAVYNQDYREDDMNTRFTSALATHSLLRLSTITYTFPVNSDKAYLAYAQSWKLVAYMYKTFGQRKVATLIRSMQSRQQTFDEDMHQALGLDVDHLEQQWHLSLHQPGTLSAEELRAEQHASPGIQISLPDSFTLRLIVLGTLLIVLPLCGLNALFLFHRRLQRRTRLAEAAESLLTSAHSPYGIAGKQGPYGSTVHPGNYTTPAAYTNVGHSSPTEQVAHYPRYPQHAPYRPPSSGSAGRYRQQQQE